MQQVWRERSSPAKLQKCFLSQVRHLQNQYPCYGNSMKYHATTLNFPRELKHIIPFQVHINFLQDMKHVGGDEDIC